MSDVWSRGSHIKAASTYRKTVLVWCEDELLGRINTMFLVT